MRFDHIAAVAVLLLSNLVLASDGTEVFRKWFPVSRCNTFLFEYELQTLLEERTDCVLVPWSVQSVRIWSLNCADDFEIFTRTPKDCDKVQGTLERQSKLYKSRR
jgi:hypothetical protein